MGQGCCNYGGNGQNTQGFDCLGVPGAEKMTDAARIPTVFCGRNNGIGSTAPAAPMAQTVCSRLTPFRVRFLSDAFEFAAAAIVANSEAANADAGFELAFFMDTTNCDTNP